MPGSSQVALCKSYVVRKKSEIMDVSCSTDESATENVLKAIQMFASLCGQLDLQPPRDAFITAICKASLPPHYALTVLYNAPQGIPTVRQQDSAAYNLTMGEPDYRQQVVAVGTPLPTASLPIGRMIICHIYTRETKHIFRFFCRLITFIILIILRCSSRSRHVDCKEFAVHACVVIVGSLSR